MYGKIFESIYEGSLYGHWEAIVTFQAMIVLANEDGELDMTPQALAGKTSIPIHVIKAGLAILQKPDPDSRSPLHEGRRIIPLEEGRAFGWQIVNYTHYRNLASREDKKRADRDRVAEKRSRKINDVADCRNDSQKVADVAHTDTNTNTELDLDRPIGPAYVTTSFDSFWDSYPKKVAKEAARKAWRKINPSAALANLILEAIDKHKTTQKWQDKGGEFIPHAATWLNQRRWEDEIAPPPIPPAATRAADERVWRDVQ